MEKVTARSLGWIVLVFGLAQLIRSSLRLIAGEDVVWGVADVVFGLVCIVGAVVLFRLSRRKGSGSDDAWPSAVSDVGVITVATGWCFTLRASGEASPIGRTRPFIDANDQQRRRPVHYGARAVVPGARGGCIHRQKPRGLRYGITAAYIREKRDKQPRFVGRS
jgi:hypothetical protein